MLCKNCKDCPNNKPYKYRQLYDWSHSTKYFFNCGERINEDSFCISSGVEVNWNGVPPEKEQIFLENSKNYYNEILNG